VQAAKYAVPEMEKAGGGSIVSISSVHGQLSARGNLAYARACLLLRLTAALLAVATTRSKSVETG
jgi:NAD(P)-dependent dehydrogenase (short-subunit alcohol dehydrogenase family)